MVRVTAVLPVKLVAMRNKANVVKFVILMAVTAVHLNVQRVVQVPYTVLSVHGLMPSVALTVSAQKVGIVALLFLLVFLSAVRQGWVVPILDVLISARAIVNVNLVVLSAHVRMDINVVMIRTVVLSIMNVVLEYQAWAAVHLDSNVAEGNAYHQYLVHAVTVKNVIPTRNVVLTIYQVRVHVVKKILTHVVMMERVLDREKNAVAATDAVAQVRNVVLMVRVPHLVYVVEVLTVKEVKNVAMVSVKKKVCVVMTQNVD